MSIVNPFLNKLKYGISLEVLGTILSLGINILIIPVYLTYINIEEYGLWLLLFSIVSTMFILDNGTDQYIEVTVANDKIFRSKKLLNHIITALLYKLKVILVIFIIGFTSYFIIFKKNYFDLKFNGLESTFIILFLSLTITYVGSTISSILHGRNKIVFLSIATSFYSILSALLNLLFLYLQFSILSFALSSLIISLTIFLHYAFILKKTLPKNIFNVSKIELIEKENISKFSFSFFILKILMFFRNYYPTIMIGYLFNSTQVSTYNLYYKLPQLLHTVGSKISTVFFPSVASLISEKRYRDLNELFFKISNILFTYSILLGVLIAIYLDDIIKYWLNQEISQAFSITIIMLIQTIILCGMGVFGITIYSKKNFGNWTSWILFEIVILILSSIYFGNKFGYIGFIYAFFLSTLINQTYIFFHVINILEIKVSKFLNEVIIKSVLKNIFPMLILILVRQFIITESIYTIATVFLIVTSISLLSNWLYETFVQSNFFKN